MIPCGSWGGVRDTVDLDQTTEQRFEPVEVQGVLGVASGRRGVVVHLKEHAVHTGCHTSRGQRLDEFCLSRRDAVATALRFARS